MAYKFDGLEQVLHLLVLFAGHCVVDPVNVEVLALLLLLLVFLKLLKRLLPTQLKS